MNPTKEKNPDKNKLTVKYEKELAEIDSLFEGVTLAQLKVVSGGYVKFPFKLNEKVMRTDLSDLELSPRAYNCLKRSSYHTIGQLVESITRTSDLLCIRSLGKKSAEEVLFLLFLYQYKNFDKAGKIDYLRRVKEMNLACVPQ